MNRRERDRHRKEAAERAAKKARKDKISTCMAIAAFLVSILHRIFFKPDVMTGEEGLRAVFVFSLLRVIFGFAADVALGIIVWKVMRIFFNDEHEKGAYKDCHKNETVKNDVKKHSKAGRYAAFVVTYVLALLIYLSMGVRASAFHTQREINRLSSIDNISYIGFVGDTFMDMKQGETITVRVKGCRIDTDILSYRRVKRGWRRSKGIVYRFSVLEDSSFRYIAQVSDIEGEELKYRLDPEKEYIIKLYKNSRLIASIDQA
ncbi:hypothetical protein [Ruminococcus flavefaciens]|uniref:Uncharacterized protein n=1 Tax=Ruminococcus flavefaciens TaxID=1265 RepID=A0A1M7I2U9_RUMFL|nr:hypothetical protein [Ruminococcus flavefaciens]SHM35035.1 hypothetical protein SAMN04487860_103252 [Ruminococcus flavefaciens]